MVSSDTYMKFMHILAGPHLQPGALHLYNNLVSIPQPRPMHLSHKGSPLTQHFSRERTQKTGLVMSAQANTGNTVAPCSRQM